MTINKFKIYNLRDFVNQKCLVGVVAISDEEPTL